MLSAADHKDMSQRGRSTAVSSAAQHQAAADHKEMSQDGRSTPGQ